MKRFIEIWSNSPNSTQAPTPLLDQSVKELSASAAKKDHYKDFPFRVNPSLSLPATRGTQNRQHRKSCTLFPNPPPPVNCSGFKSQLTTQTQTNPAAS
jgi:hypothetical protein